MTIHQGKKLSEEWVGGYGYKIKNGRVKYYVLPNSTENTTYNLEDFVEVSRAEYDLVFSRVKKDIQESFCREHYKLTELPVYTNPFSGLDTMVESIQNEKEFLRKEIMGKNMV